MMTTKMMTLLSAAAVLLPLPLRSRTVCARPRDARARTHGTIRARALRLEDPERGSSTLAERREVCCTLFEDERSILQLVVRAPALSQ